MNPNAARWPDQASGIPHNRLFGAMHAADRGERVRPAQTVPRDENGDPRRQCLLGSVPGFGTRHENASPRRSEAPTVIAAMCRISVNSVASTSASIPLTSTSLSAARDNVRRKCLSTATAWEFPATRHTWWFNVRRAGERAPPAAVGEVFFVCRHRAVISLASCRKSRSNCRVEN